MLIIYALIVGIIFSVNFIFFGLFPQNDPYLLKFFLFSLFISLFWPISIPILLIWRKPILNWIINQH